MTSLILESFPISINKNNWFELINTWKMLLVPIEFDIAYLCGFHKKNSQLLVVAYSNESL